MAETQALVKTWGCGTCGYYVDFDPGDATLWAQHITAAFPSVPQGKCPAGWIGATDDRTTHHSDLAGIVDLSQLSTVTVKDPAVLDMEERPVLGSNNRPVVTFDSDGNPSAQMRPLTDAEKVVEREKITVALDDLSNITVKDVTPS